MCEHFILEEFAGGFAKHVVVRSEDLANADIHHIWRLKNVTENNVWATLCLNKN